MKFQQAVTSLEHDRENKFILKGSEPYLKKYFISKVKNKYKDYKIFFPDDQKEAFDVLGSGSFFESPAVILIRFNEMDLKQFEPLIKNYEECVVASLDEKVTKGPRELTKIISIMKVVECNQLKSYGSPFPLWISSKITAAGFEAPGRVHEMIFAQVGPNMSVISSELEKLFIVKSDSKVITESDVSLYVSQTAMSTIFEMFEYLMKRNVKKALECFYSYTRSHTTYIDVISFLGKYFEKMYRILLLKEEGFSVNDIAEIIGLAPFLVKTRYLPRAKAFGKAQIAAKINAVCALDVKSRLFRGDKRILMEKFILDFK